MLSKYHSFNHKDIPSFLHGQILTDLREIDFNISPFCQLINYRKKIDSVTTTNFIQRLHIIKMAIIIVF